MWGRVILIEELQLLLDAILTICAQFGVGFHYMNLHSLMCVESLAPQTLNESCLIIRCEDNMA